MRNIEGIPLPLKVICILNSQLPGWAKKPNGHCFLVLFSGGLTLCSCFETRSHNCTLPAVPCSVWTYSAHYQRRDCRTEDNVRLLEVPHPHFLLRAVMQRKPLEPTDLVDVAEPASPKVSGVHCQQVRRKAHENWTGLTLSSSAGACVFCNTLLSSNNVTYRWPLIKLCIWKGLIKGAMVNNGSVTFAAPLRIKSNLINLSAKKSWQVWWSLSKCLVVPEKHWEVYVGMLEQALPWANW